jgi:uncharacterized protein (TIGR02246 family)
MDASNARTGIEDGNREFAAALGRKDFSALAALYTADAVVMPPNGRPVSGRKAIEEFWEAAHAALGIKSITLRTIEVFSAGDIATEMGEASLLIASGTANLKYIVLWRRDNVDIWQLHRDIWNDTP